MITIAIRNLFAKKTRTALALLGLIIGVMAIVSLISITEGVKSNIDESFSQLNGVTILEKDAVMPLFSKIDGDTLKEMESVQGVRVVCPRVMALINKIDGKSGSINGYVTSIAVIGIDPSKEVITRKGVLPNGENIIKGRVIKPSDHGSVVVLDTFAEKYDKRIGSKIKLNDKDFIIVGIFERSASQGSTIISHIEDARELADLPSNTYSVAYIEPVDANRDKELKTRLEFKYGEDFDIRTTQETADTIGALLSNVDSFLWIISLIATGVAGLGIINTMLMSIRERMKEFGVLRAMGWTQKDVIQLVLTESIIIGIIGGIIGLIFGWIAVQIAKGLLGIPMLVTLPLSFQAIMFGVIVGVIGGIYPAWKASQMDPIEAVRSE